MMVKEIFGEGIVLRTQRRKGVPKMKRSAVRSEREPLETPPELSNSVTKNE